MKKTFLIFLAFFCLADAAQGEEQQDVESMEINLLQVEKRLVADDVVLAAESVDIAKDKEDNGIEEPTPIVPADVEIGEETQENIRDPFDDVSEEQAMPADYSLVAELVSLRGVVKMGSRQMGLFVVTKSRDEELDYSKTVLRRVDIGERIRVYTSNDEYTFILKSLGKRSAVIVGENKEAYDIWL